MIHNVIANFLVLLLNVTFRQLNNSNNKFYNKKKQIHQYWLAI